MKLLAQVCIYVQMASFVGAAVTLFATGKPKLALAQILLSAVTGLVYL